mgnify:CR=1 FL=1
MGQLKRLVIHCTDTRQGHEVTGDEIRRWHTTPVSKGGRGWKQVGYADIIHLNGGVENLVPYNDDQTVDPWEVTNGAAGYNSTSRHVVYVGGRSMANEYADTRTPKQRSALEKYVRQFRLKHPGAEIVGHRDLPGASKECPCFDVKRWLKEIKLL